jgi:glycosyltransferase involved in cell wall biosynthesis
MKLVYLITRSEPFGGAQVHVRDLARAFRDRRHEVHVLVGSDGLLTEELRASGIPVTTLRHLVRPLDARKDSRAFLEVRAALKALQPNLVATHSSKAGWIGRAAARSLGMPVVFTAHGWAFTDGVPAVKRTVYWLAERLAGPLASRVITVSEHDRELAIRLRVLPAHKVVTVHNGMPDVPSLPLAQPSCENVRMTMVARFQEQKDHALLLTALSGLRDRPWQLELIGDGPLQPAVEEQARRLGLDRQVQFLGVRRDVAERLARSQLFVLATRWEGFPYTTLEAMRAGLPVIASDVGGVREAVAHGETGFLVPRGDVEALRRRLSELLAAPELRRRLGAAGRRSFETTFTFERMIDKTAAVYQAVARA